MPDKKREWGYRYESDKFRLAGLTPVASETVAPPRVQECPVQMEGCVHTYHAFGKNVNAYAFEVHIERLHVDQDILIGNGHRPHVDPVKWQPLIMSFCRFFGMGNEVHPSRLAESDFMRFVRGGTGAPVAVPVRGN